MKVGELKKLLAWIPDKDDDHEIRVYTIQQGLYGTEGVYEDIDSIYLERAGLYEISLEP